jgi:hypothetical protein
MNMIKTIARIALVATATLSATVSIAAPNPPEVVGNDVSSGTETAPIDALVRQPATSPETELGIFDIIVNGASCIAKCESRHSHCEDSCGGHSPVCNVGCAANMAQCTRRCR